ncbi:MAG TPA: 2'-5' RNA ligase family protein [Candidatus Saccharimonadales bacterium]|nr:2'-5' RNA ligase family protein [Candidatus Saccharimonadales bacterium]
MSTQQHAIVYFPKIDVKTLTTFREKYDPKWQIIAPHITLVYPVSGIPEKVLITHIETVTKEIHSFPIVLGGLMKSFDHCLFLLVKEGNENILHVCEKLYSGILLPYAHTTIPFIPHITIGYFGREDDSLHETLYKQAFEEAEKMNIQLSARFDRITLIKGDGITPATIIKTFAW